ncbi:MAG: hypothetical protein JJV90_00640 [Spiroplasma sp.]|nr:hypothetical protein [Mycoplasmatales bacterium]
MLKIKSGVIKKVLTDEQFDLVMSKKIEGTEISLDETVRELEKEDGTVVEYLPFRVSFKEFDNKGNDKYIFNEEKKEYQLCYKISPIIRAYGKEMRILLEMKEYNPVKVVVEESINEKGKLTKLICVQNQLNGILEQQ